jgi:DNA-binding NarL/FixJ family response regulator
MHERSKDRFKIVTNLSEVHMASLPRILTVDPTGRIPQQVRGAIDLMDRLVIQIDVPDGTEALEELKRAKCTAVIAAWVTGDQMPGWALAGSIKKIYPDMPIIILADLEDKELDDEMRNASPFVYLKRPFEIEQFLRVLKAALEGEDIFAAAKPPLAANAPIAQVSYGPMPQMNAERARGISQKLLTDMNALGLLLCSRDGEIILELGVIGMDRTETGQKLVKGVMANIELKEMIGGNAATLQFYDGDEYDVYVLSAGYHYFTVLVFKGQDGAKQMGNVSRWGRRASEDLVALMGAEAWLLRRAVEEEKAPAAPRRSDAVTKVLAANRPTVEVEPEVPLVRAEFKKDKTAENPVVEVTPLLEAIPDEDFNLDDIFGSGALGGEGSDVLFSLESLEELANADTSAKRGMTWDDAVNTGLLQE